MSWRSGDLYVTVGIDALRLPVERKDLAVEREFLALLDVVEEHRVVLDLEGVDRRALVGDERVVLLRVLGGKTTLGLSRDAGNGYE